MLAPWVAWTSLQAKHLAEGSVGPEIYATVSSAPNVRSTVEEGKARSICSSRMPSAHGKLEAEAKWVIEIRADGSISTKETWPRL